MQADSTELLRVLIMCDEQSTGDVIEGVVDSRATVTVASSEQVLEVCREWDPGALVADIAAQRSAAFEGLQTLVALRGLLGDTPLLVLTWEPLPARLAEGVAVLNKPFSLAALRAAVDELISCAAVA